MALRSERVAIQAGPPRQACHCIVFVASASLAIGGCSTRFAAIETFAAEQRFQHEVIAGDAFLHRVYRQVGQGDPNGTLNVYLEGDGSPYHSRYAIAADPTPANPVMLRLMALDPGPAVYVGRPCYLDTVHHPPCHPYYWTLGRFSSEVVSSLAAVIRHEAAKAGAGQLRIFGHSGGGALAVLVVRELSDLEVTELVTLAGNLDHGLWTELHDYMPLLGSLNPVDGGPLPGSIRQLHLFGETDRNIPPELMKKAAEEFLGGRWLVVPGVWHTCCWEAIWPAVLAGQMTD